MNDAGSIIKTYIICTLSKEYYVGKTTNLEKRLSEHKQEKYPRWFCNNQRRIFMKVYTFNGDYEKQIKRAGVKLITELLENLTS